MNVSKFVHLLFRKLLVVLGVLGVTAAFSTDAFAEEVVEAEGGGPVLIPTVFTDLVYQTFSDEHEGHTGFAIGHLRPGLVLEPTDWFRGVVSVEWAVKTPKILDGYARIQASDSVVLMAGYSKTPLFTNYADNSLQTLVFSERAPTVEAFRGARDVGVEARYLPKKQPFEARVRVGNGSGSPIGNNNMLPAGYGAVALVLGRAHSGYDAEKGDPGAFGLRIGAAGFVEDTTDRTGIEGTTPLGFTYYRAAIVTGFRAVGQAHVVYYGGPLRVTLESAYAHENRSYDHDGNPDTGRVAQDAVDSYGVGVELEWMLLGKPRLPGKLPESGSLEVAARYDYLQFGLGAADVNPGGAHETAVVLKWWPSGFMSTSLSGYLNRFDVPPIEMPDTNLSWNLAAHLGFFWGRGSVVH